jgi:Carbohydrate-selective porin
MRKIIATILAINLIKSGNTQAILDSNKHWNYHFQFTSIIQGHPSFKAKYSGSNSLNNNAEKNVLSITSTLFIGRRLWKNAAMYTNAEIAGGEGVSSAKGIAGFTNGETFRIGTKAPTLYLARLYFQQYFPLRNTVYEKVSGEANQLEGHIPTPRIILTVGKFGLSDFFDDNKYSHDPRLQFMNWSLMSNGAWDYPANTRGYTTGIVLEYASLQWAARLSAVVVPRKANGLVMDYHLDKAHGLTIELEKDWKRNKSGALRVLAFRNSSQAPTYNTTLKEVKYGDSLSVPVFTGETEWKKYGGVKYGFGLNVEQEFINDIGAFLRTSWNDGKTATWAFTEIDRSGSAGFSIKGKYWKRPDDNLGIAEVMNGISIEHRNFLNAGLYGFIIGDGKLNYGLETITEIYYQAHLATTLLGSVDYQFVKNPAYNKDRGPVHLFAIRMHIEL